MLSEIIVCIEMQKSVMSEVKVDVAKACKSRFEAPDPDKDEYEAIFKLLLQEVQKQSRDSE